MAASLSPFRYPGGKGRLMDSLMPLLKPILDSTMGFADVFVGGGSVVLNVAKEYPDKDLYINDKDPRLAYFWKIVASDHVDDLISRLDITPTVDMFFKLRDTKPKSEVDYAFHGIFFNKTSFSGILDAGPIGGKGQTSKYSVGCRYNPPALIKKIEVCHQLLNGRTQVDCKDFRANLVAYDPNVAIFLDPPYFEQGSGLYTEQFTDKEYIEMEKFLSKRNNWVLTIDDCQTIRDLFGKYNVSEVPAKYSINSKPKKKKELFIRG